MLNASGAWIDEMLGAVAGVSLTYTRGATTLTLAASDGDASIGREDSASDRDGGTRIESSGRVYFVRVSALTLGEPAEGDLIQETVNGVARRYKVMRPETGDRAWRFWDAEQTVYRIHTRRV